MLGNLLKLGNIQIRDIMVPRADIVSINIDSDFEATLKLFIEAAQITQITPRQDGLTFYSSYGDVFSWLCLLATGLIAITGLRKIKGP